jgi:hypothetical protein
VVVVVVVKRYRKKEISKDSGKGSEVNDPSNENV